jgi:hypothetical protein
LVNAKMLCYAIFLEQFLSKSNAMTLPVILVAGFSQAARRRLVREALERQSASRVAWLDHQDSLLPAFDTDTSLNLQPTQSFVACVCCAGSLVFTTHLARLLRLGPWSGLVISLGARAEPVRMMSLLSQTPWREHLGPIRLFSVMDEAGIALCALEQHPLHELACQQRSVAEAVLSPGQCLPIDVFVRS